MSEIRSLSRHRLSTGRPAPARLGAREAGPGRARGDGCPPRLGRTAAGQTAAGWAGAGQTAAGQTGAGRPGAGRGGRPSGWSPRDAREGEVVTLLRARPTIQAATDTDTCRRLLAGLRASGTPQGAYAPAMVPRRAPLAGAPAARPASVALALPGRRAVSPQRPHRPRGTGGPRPPAA